MRPSLYKIILFVFSLFAITIAQEKTIISRSDKTNSVLAPQAPPPAVHINGPNNGIGLIFRTPLDDQNQEFGTIDFTPLQNNVVDSDDIKLKLFKVNNNGNHDLVYGGNFEATEKITAQQFQMTNGAGSGKILTSSSNGTASWQTPSSGSSGSIDGLSDGKAVPNTGSVYLGDGAGTNDDSPGITDPSNNTALGINALNLNGLVASQRGEKNTAVGFEALKNLDNNNGNENTAVGSQAHLYNVSGTQNTAVGTEALSGYSGGDENIAIGYQALKGGSNSANGHQNIAIGVGALNDNISGDNNVAIGYKAGFAHTGDDQLFIQNRTLPSYDPLIWGRFAPGIIRLQVNAENASTTNLFYVNGSAGGTSSWSGSSDRRLKKNISTVSNSLDKIQKLRGVNFEWKDPKNHREGLQMGFIAQEAIEVIPEVVEDKAEFMSMQYAPITALLVEGMKEQQNIIDSQEKRIKQLEEQNAQFGKILSKIESSLDSKRFSAINN